MLCCPMPFAGYRGAAGGRCRAGRAACCAALVLLPVLSGCGAAATVGSTLYSISEAIATIVKDDMKEPDGSAPETRGGPGRGGE